MDFLNSQHLTTQDGYAHPFSQPGEFTYGALLAGTCDATDTGKIIVSGEKVPEGEGTQYNIVFHWDIAARQFRTNSSREKLEIRPNDFVVFHFSAAVPGQPPCSIRIWGKDSVEGDSRHLRTHDAFSHFFLEPGEYAYRLGEGVYRISVGDHRSMEEEEHEQQVRRPLVIMVNGPHVSVTHGHMVAGQSAIWAMEHAENAHIEVLLANAASKVELNPQPLPPKE
jgi:hypothetical protein